MRNLVLLLWVMLAFPCQAQELRLNSGLSKQYSNDQGTGIADRLVEEAFNRIDVWVLLERLPPRRGIFLANSGEHDGHYFRTGDVIDQYSNLVKVPVVIARVAGVAVTRPSGPVISDWASLRGHRVGYWIGHEQVRLRQRRFGQASAVPSLDNLVELLNLNRLDVALMEMSMARYTLQQTGYEDEFIIQMPPLEYSRVYLALNQKHSRLVPKLVQALNGMHQDGTLAGICPLCAESLGGSREGS